MNNNYLNETHTFDEVSELITTGVVAGNTNADIPVADEVGSDLRFDVVSVAGFFFGNGGSNRTE
jgi:hypothetical protein